MYILYIIINFGKLWIYHLSIIDYLMKILNNCFQIIVHMILLNLIILQICYYLSFSFPNFIPIFSHVLLVRFARVL